MNPYLTAAICAACTALPAQVVFTDNFDSTMPAAVQPGTAQLEGVLGYAGLGPAGNQFGTTFLRSATGNQVVVTLTNLPPHTTLQLGFLFAAIDSLDGSGTYPSGDYFKVTLDSVTIFRESFANAVPSQIQSYVPPAGGTLARHVDLGFSGPGSYYTDSAYDMYLEPAFQNLAHTGSTAVLTFQFEGPGNQSLGDESWAMDNLQIAVGNGSNPATITPYGTSCGPNLTAATAPIYGTAVLLTLSNLPGNVTAAFLCAGFSSTSWSGGALPYDLASFGMPGCHLYNDMSLSAGLLMVMQGSSASLVIGIPNAPSLSGLHCYVQGYAFANGVNALGVVASGGLDARVGQ